MRNKKVRTLLAALFIGTAVFAAGCSEQENTTEKEVIEENNKTSENEQTGETEQTSETGANNLGTFTTQDIYGETVTQEIFQDYDLTLVNLFATWCSPCIAEMPELAQLQMNMKEQGVNVVAVVLDSLDNSGNLNLETLVLAKQIAEQSRAEFSFVVPDETYFNGRLLGVQAVPESFFVDKNGNIVGETYVGARDLSTWTDIVKLELENLKGGTP